MSTTIEEDYIENLSNEILDWCETLVGKGKFDFKQSECKEKFVVVMEGKVVKACELLCAKNKILQDPSSRRIIVYKMDASVVSKAEESLAAKTAALPAPVPAVPKKIPTSKASESDIGVLKPKKTKAVDPVTSVKKQKVADTSGVKKISSYFSVQPKTPALPAPSSTQNNDENSKPHTSSANSSTSSDSSHSTDRSLKLSVPVSEKLLAVPKPMFVVEDYSPFKPEPDYSEDASLNVAITEEMITKVCKLIVAETERLTAIDSDEQLCVPDLMSQLGEGAQEEELRVVLQRLEGQNKIMVDGDTIYVV